MRWMKRLVAKHNMRKAGFTKLFSKKKTGCSIFSLRWRDFV